MTSKSHEEKDFFPPFSFRKEDFAGDITALVKGRNKEVAEMAKKVMKKKKEEVELSVTEKGREGKSKMIASCGLENDLGQFSREEGVTLADSVETLGVDFRTRVKRLGAKEKRRKKCNVRCQEVVMCGYENDASKDLESPCGGDVSYGEVKV